MITSEVCMKVIQYQNGKIVPPTELAEQKVESTLDYPTLPPGKANLPISPEVNAFFRQDSYYPDLYWRYERENGNGNWVRVNCNPNPIK
jgi:hypothetical protein